MTTSATPVATSAAGARHVPGRVARWRGRAFGPASELPYRRRTADKIRLVVAAVLLAITIAHQGHGSQSERGIFDAVNGLPNDLQPLFELLYRFGALWALGLVVVAAVIARRWRLGRDLAIAGVVAWVLARFIGALVVGNGGVLDGIDVVTCVGDGSPSFPAVRLAVIVAVISVASPYVTRPSRRLGQLLVLLMALAALYLGTTVPNGALAAIVLGWGIAGAVHLAFGSPGGRPTTSQVTASLEQLGVVVRAVQLADPQPARGTMMTAGDDQGPLDVRVLGRDEADEQFLAKASRFLLYKDGGPTVHLTRLEDVQAEAYSVLLAERAGVRVPHLVVAGTAGPGAALLVTRPVQGVRLADVEGATATDEVLDDVWGQVVLLHGAGIVHGCLNARHVVLRHGGVALTDFATATGTGGATPSEADVAELLVSTAGLVGVERAVAAAHRTLGDDVLTGALPLLQPAALSREVRSSLALRHKELGKLVAAVRGAAAAATGSDEPPLQQLHRVSGTNLMMAVGTLIALFVLLGQVGSPQELYDTIKNADFYWLAVAMIISFATNVATAIASMGTVPIPLPLWRTSELQLSMSFSNLAVPAVGGMAAQIRFLQKQGVDLASAVASGGLLINVGNIVAQVILLVFAVVLSPDTFKTQKIPTSSIVSFVLLAILVLAVATALVFGIPKLRKLVLPPIESASATMWAAVRSPRRVALLLGGNALNAIMYAAVMQACVLAFGGSINFFTLLALNIFISTIASLVPVPGGNTAVSTVGMSGAMTAFGVSTEVAVAAVLANQLVANYIPAIPGWFATNDMLHHDYL